MDDIRVLQFRLGSETYSIPADDVGAVLQNNRWNKLTPSDINDASEEFDQHNRILQVLDNHAILATRDGMPTIILHVNGIQVALAVDEVINEAILDKNSIRTSTFIPFIIWKLGEKKWIVSLAHQNSCQISM